MTESSYVLLLCATDVERKAVLAAAKAAVGRKHTLHHGRTRTYYLLGDIGGASVALVQCEKGSGTPGGSESTVFAAIDELHPYAVIMVGIAFGVDKKNQSIGQVLVSENVRCYEIQRVGTKNNKGIEIQPRGGAMPAATWLLGRFQAACEARNDLKTKPGLILSGEKLVDNKEFRDALLKFEPEAIGGEMEAAGMAAAAHDRQTSWILVKAICDWADGLKKIDKPRRQQLAARHAASLVFTALKLGGFTRSPIETRDSGPMEKASLPAEAAKLPIAIIKEIRLGPGLLGARGPKRVPCELPPAAEKFFGRGKERRLLAERLKAGLNTAVVGPAGLGKTALAAGALADVVGANAARLAGSPYPDGLVYLDLYSERGKAEPVWSALANRLCGPEFLERAAPRERAAAACCGKLALVILEGGEEADGTPGRAHLPELLGVLPPECRWLLLTRLNTQAAAVETVFLREALPPDDAAALLDSLTESRPLEPAVRRTVLELLEGHPLAITWAGNLLARDEEDPAELAGEWKAGGLPGLTDPRRAEHTLRWLFGRSVRSADETARLALRAAGLLARAPFPAGPIAAAVSGAEDGDGGRSRALAALKGLVQRGLLRRAPDEIWEFTHALGYAFAREMEPSDPELRRRLADWLRENLLDGLQGSSGGEGLSAAGRLIPHAAALLRADDGRRLWEQLAGPLLYGISDRLEEMGRLDLVSGALGAAAEWLSGLPTDQAEAPFWRRQYCILRVDQGDVLLAQGDLAGALASYRESLTIAKRLAE
ncbi:MAG: hypothetical protein JW929_05795, partial [Anaerolineales bacterium]|nr:hypothetical protein [Anaerolineales bacterium]